MAQIWGCKFMSFPVLQLNGLVNRDPLDGSQSASLQPNQVRSFVSRIVFICNPKSAFDFQHRDV